MNFIKKMLVILFLVAQLAGCASNIKLQGSAVNYLNPDIDGQPSPVVITVYQLQNNDAFQHASYGALMLNAGQALGSDLLDKNTFEVQPGTTFKIKEKTYPNTKFIGLIAGYRDPSTVHWHKIIPLDKPGSSISLQMLLQTEGMYIEVK